MATLLAPLKTALALVVVDQAGAWVCVALTVGAAWLLGIQLEAGAEVLPGVCGALFLGNWACGLYPGIGIHPVTETRQVIVASTTVIAVTLLVVGAANAAQGIAPALAMTWLFSIVVLPLGRMLGRAVCSRYAWWRQPIAVLGGNETAQHVAARLRRMRTLGLEPVGQAHGTGKAKRHRDIQHSTNHRPVNGQSGIGLPTHTARLFEQPAVQWAILAIPEKPSADSRESQAALLAAAASYPHVLIVDETHAVPTLWSRTMDIDGCTVTHTFNHFGAPTFLGLRLLKRSFDIVFAAMLVMVLLPVLLLIAGWIRLSSPGPVFYSQQRVGRGGRPFRAWKFRTMRPDADRLLAEYLLAHPDLREEWANNHKLKDDPRVIPGVGRFLRNYSLDELPQLWNVLCGEMSLVGPRPIVQEEIPKYQDDFALYVRVPPGITGLWQISGRNNTTYTRRVFLDAYYIRNWSPWLDYYILLRTLKTVLLREGAY